MAFCINCDNRHGCKTGLPACLRLDRAPGEERLRGRQVMQRRGMLGQCAQCKDFGICWTAEGYAEAKRAEGKRRGLR